ncbi:MAG: hypothetical protein ACRD5H_00140 [Nitrososphaerales archaeon]
MADSFVRVPPDSTGKAVDCASLTVSTTLVYRQRVQVAGVGATDIASIDATFGISADIKRALTITTVISSAPTLSVQITSAPTLTVEISRAPTLTVQVSSAVTLTVAISSAPTLTVQISASNTVPVQVTSANTLTVQLSNTASITDSITLAPVPQVGSFGYLYNSVTGVWNRLRGDVAQGLDVDVTRVTGTLSVQVTSFSGTISAQITSAVTLTVAISSAATLTVQVSSAVTLTVAANIATIPAAILVSNRSVIGGLVSDTGVSYSVQVTTTSVGALGTNTVVTPVAALACRVIGYRLQNISSLTQTVLFSNSRSLTTTLMFPWVLAPREGVVASAPPGCFEFQSTTSLGVAVILGTASLTVGVQLMYINV